MNINIEHFLFLIGLKVSADHPRTVLNPDESFLIKEVRIDNNNLYIRGENTMWFHSSLITRAE